MPIQSTDTTSITVAADNEIWVIKAGVVVAGGYAALTDSYSYTQIANYGTLIGSGFGLSASQGPAAIITNAASGYISGFNAGVSIDQEDSILYNYGNISGHNNGVAISGDNDVVENSGSISGSTAVQIVGAGSRLLNSGTISGGTIGVEVDTTSGSSRIVNSGVIQGGYLSIADSYLYTSVALIQNTGQLIGDVSLRYANGACSILNTGLIAGGVTFGLGADTYDGRLGTVTGTVSGGDGNDLLIGGSGDDALNGGAGRDRLDGGKGGGDDTFVFAAATDSRPSGPDVITRHWTGNDTIDLSAIDANRGHAGDQAFTFGGLINAGDAVASGSVAYYHARGDTYVVADTDADGQADFQLIIRGNFTLYAGEFVL